MSIPSLLLSSRIWSNSDSPATEYVVPSIASDHRTLWPLLHTWWSGRCRAYYIKICRNLQLENGGHV
jgi:hypothetical protein